MTLDAIVNIVRPFLVRIATHPSVKKLVIQLLEKYVSTTDNSIDDAILQTVKDLISKPQEV
jgi:hypothetical protein